MEKTTSTATATLSRDAQCIIAILAGLLAILLGAIIYMYAKAEQFRKIANSNHTRVVALETALKGAAQRIAQEVLLGATVMIAAPEETWRAEFDEYISSGKWLEESRECGKEVHKVLLSTVEADYRK